MSGYRRYFRLRGVTRRDLQQEMADEIDAHIAFRVEELMRGGVSRARASALAQERFGDRAVLMRTVLERERRRNRGEWMESVVRDVRLAWRQLSRAPGSALLTVTTFALGIGLTTAMFTVADRVLLRPLPFERPEQLVALAGMDAEGNVISRVSYEDWRDLAEANRTLAATAIHAPRDQTLLVGGRGRSIPGAQVSGAFFDVVRPPLVVGRGFAPGDERTGALVVSEAVWRSHLGARGLEGAQLDVDGSVLPVVGVVRAGYEYPAGAQVWRLFTGVRRGGGALRNNINWSAVARLAPGVSRAQAESDLRGVAAGVRAADRAGLYLHGVVVTDLRGTLVAEARASIRLLFGAVCLVLLIGCSNVAALTLARAARRRSDIATLFALGAGRGRVFRQLLTEQLVLAMVGGVIGVLVARASVSLIARAAANRLPRAHELSMDLRVLAFALAAALVSGLLAGMWPALRASSMQPHASMSRRGVLPGGRGLAGGAMLAGEVALALVLLVAGGLLLRSMRHVLERDVGFATAGVAAAQVVLTPARFQSDTSAAPRFWQNLLDVLKSDPSVAHVALANWVPTGTGGTSFLEVEGVPEQGGAAYRVTSDDYFETMRMPILRGRSFTAQDAATGERVAVISRALAERYWPNADPIGARIRTPGMEGYVDVPWLRVVGVTVDIRHGGHESDASAHVYVLQRQRPEHRAMHVIVRTVDGAARTAAQAIENAVVSLDPALAVETRDLERELASLIGERRLLTAILGLFASLSLLLAATGIYGLFSYAVVQRAHEIGVRTALGADRVRIIRLVLGDALRVVCVGCIGGVIGAYWMTKLLRSQLAGVTTSDPITYGAAFVVIVSAALIAAAAPSVRAARIDPQVALRST